MADTEEPEKHLKAPDFLALLSVLEWISLTRAAVTSVIEHPSAAITIVRPTAIVTLLAEWVRGTCKPTSFGPYVGGVLLVFGDVSASRTTKDGQTTLSTSGTDAPTALLLDRT